MRLIALVLAVVCAACSDPAPPGAPSVVDATITEVFTATLNQFGTNVHQFTVNQIGTLTVTLNSVVPGAAVGVNVGTPSVSTGSCIAISSLTAVGGPNTQISGTATITGSFCVSVTDVGNLVEPVTYTITVNHS
ncbi:MAG TPA: hypothetical protein VEU08_05345 [Vicinamibacterales bacterium]|nr:hypothetical protein [Vicinamibacterales bacterium]